MKAIRRFTVRTVLPEPLRPLGKLAANLRWSWHQETRELFRSIDPEGWQAAQGDPVRLLGAVPEERLAALAADRRFLRRLAAAVEDLADYTGNPRWYQGRNDVPAGFLRSEVGACDKREVRLERHQVPGRIPAFNNCWLRSLAALHCVWPRNESPVAIEQGLAPTSQVVLGVSHIVTTRGTLAALTIRLHKTGSLRYDL